MPLRGAFRGSAAALFRLLPSLTLAPNVQAASRDDALSVISPPMASPIPIMDTSGAFRILPQPPARMARANASTLQGLAMMADAVEGLVEREVNSVARRRYEKVSSRANAGPAPVADSGTASIVSEPTVKALIRRMRELAQEERFRRGKLR